MSYCAETNFLSNEEIWQKDSKYLFFNFLVDGGLFAPSAKLLELNFSLNEFLVLSAPVIDAFAILTGKFDKLWLWHDFYNISPKSIPEDF